MEMSRRELLRLASWLGFAPFFAGGLACTTDESVGDDLPRYDYTGDLGPADLFADGVASGDPLPRAVILWTRVAVDTSSPVDAFWEVAEDVEFERRVAAGWVMTDPFRDYTVKVDATGLEPGQTYYYRFQALGRTSPLGRTRTAAEGALSQLRLAVVSCAQYTAGYYYAYRFIAERPDLDAVVHLGDYIYEGGGELREGERVHDPPHECVTLEDYRTRYAQYRSDLDLQAAHRQHPFICVWDDHETSNNSWSTGAKNHDPEVDGDWTQRRAWGEQAFAEWLPIRESADGRIFRSLQFGDLAELIMLDTRLWGRDAPATSPTDRDTIRDPARTMLGADQEVWLEERLTGSTARWKLLGQQVMFGQLKGQPGTNAEGGGQILNVDQWDGYWGARDRLFELIKREQIGDIVVLSGDIHSSWAMDLNDDPNNPESYDPATGAGSLAVELVCPGVSSGIELNPVSVDLLANLAQTFNPHIKWLDLSHRGYFILDVTTEHAQAAWWLIQDVDDPVAGSELLAAIWETRAGENRLVEADEPAQALSPVAPLAP